MRCNRCMTQRRALAALVALLALTWHDHAYAFVPTARPLAADVLTALPAAGVSRSLRAQRQVRAQTTPPAAWNTFVARAGGRWDAVWDAATGVPSQIWGSGIPSPGSNARADLAEAAARRVLADHVALARTRCRRK